MRKKNQKQRIVEKNYDSLYFLHHAVIVSHSKPDIIDIETSNYIQEDHNMKLLIGEKLKSYRRKKNLTQEEIAAHLGISCQSISKWERSDGYPDITMLPALAKYFGITVDELLGVDELTAASRYDEINRIWFETHQKAKEEHNDELHRQNIALMRDALKEYPNDPLLLVKLSSSLERLDGTPEEKKANLKESILLQEQILRGEDSEVRSATLYNICFAYEKNGEHEKALETAKKLPNLYKARENAMVSLTTGKAKHQAALCALAPMAYIISHHLTALAETEQDERWRDKIQQIHDILFDEITLDEVIQLRLEQEIKSQTAR